MFVAGSLVANARPGGLSQGLFWLLLCVPLVGAAMGTWAAMRRGDAERRLRAQRNALRDEVDRVRHRERVVRGVFEHSQAAVLVHDPGGRILVANRSAERIFGRREEDIKRCLVSDLLPDLHQLREHDALLRQSAAGEPLGREWRTRGRHADGTAFPVQLERAELPELRATSVVLREATSVVKAEQKRVREALRIEQDRAVDLSRHRAEFLDRLGRELRSHVGRVLEACEGLAHQLDATDAGMASNLRDSGHGMLVIVDKLLNLGMADDSLQALSLEPVAVPGLLDELVHSLQPMLERNGNALEVRVSDQVPILTTDRQKLAHAVRNLLSNAARYTRGGRITVEVLLEPGRGTDWVAFFVTDTGVGLTPQDMDQLFEVFSLPDAASTQEYLSIGTGLALSQHCARLLGGHIAVRSAAGEGSVFTLRIPLHPPEVPPEPPSEPPGLRRLVCAPPS